ncbi:MAG: imidazolonepropionase [Gemmatimonadota bacterium]
MNADRLLTNIGQLVTPSGSGVVRGRAMRDLTVIRDAAIAISGGRVTWRGPRSEWTGSAASEIDAGGRAVVPGMIDPHTHAVWGGDRLADFDARTSGKSYEAILAGGGGIRHTVACTNATSMEVLQATATQRLQRMMAAGATTIEIKSGYGATWEGETRQLDLVRALELHVPARLVATMLFHVPPADPGVRDAYVREAVEEWIPALALDDRASAIDVFIEREAFSLAEADQLMRAARAAGLACKAHADQFSAMGATELAIGHGALSVDHLEASGPAQVTALAESPTVGVLLPGVTLHLGLPAAPGRALIDAGAAVAVGTDCNPGSSPLFSISLAMALAVRLNGLTAAEALTAVTANAAAALHMADVGRIAPGMSADFLILRSADWRDLPYTLGDDAVDRVFITGFELPRT